MINCAIFPNVNAKIEHEDFSSSLLGYEEMKNGTKISLSVAEFSHRLGKLHGEIPKGV